MMAASGLAAEHFADVPPFIPAQSHDHGPSATPAALPPLHDHGPFAVPLAHSAVGLVALVVPFAVPHAPLVAPPPLVLGAEQLAVVPPEVPAQVHVHGP